jgi:hypothetical protein
VNRRRLILCVLVWLAVGSAGCGSEFTRGRGPGGSRVTSSRAWTVTGDLSHPEYMADDRDATVAISGGTYRGAEVTVDFSKPCLLNMIVMRHGSGHEMGFPRRVAVATSMDGENWNHAMVALGTRRVTVVPLVTPTLARYIRLRALEEGGEPWAVAELIVQ